MKHNTRKSLFLLGIITVIIALVTMACQIPFLSSIIGQVEKQLPEQQVESPGEGGIQEEQQVPQVGITPGESELKGPGWGSAIPDGITASGEGFTAGEILKVDVHNPSDQPTTVTIPCGLVFNPPTGSGEQMLMVIQGVVEEIPARGTAELKPYVVCIESSASVPSDGSAYQVGSMAEGKLLQLADCFCKEKLDPSMTAFQEMLGVQFATWMVAGDMDLDELTANPGTGAGNEIMQAFGSMMEMFSEPAQQWLDKCGIDTSSE